MSHYLVMYVWKGNTIGQTYLCCTFIFVKWRKNKFFRSDKIFRCPMDFNQYFCLSKMEGMYNNLFFPTQFYMWLVKDSSFVMQCHIIMTKISKNYFALPHQLFFEGQKYNCRGTKSLIFIFQKRACSKLKKICCGVYNLNAFLNYIFFAFREIYYFNLIF